MTLLGALSDSHTFWEVTLGIGVVVVAVVIALMLLLLSFVGDIERNATRLVEGAGELAGNTTNLRDLASTAQVLDAMLTEATVHATYFAGSGG